MDEAEEEEVVANEPWCEVQCRCQSRRCTVTFEQTCEVWNLEDVEDDPVDGDDDAVQGEGGMVMAVLAPNCTTVVVTFMGSFEGIVDGGYDEDKPGDGCKDFVGEDGVFGVA